PGEAAIAIELGALHGDADRARVGIAEHGLEARAEHGVEELWKVVALGRRAGRADRDVAPFGILDRRDATLGPGDAGGDIAADAAEPAEFERVVARLLIAIERLGHQAARWGGDHAAVARRDVIEVVEHDDAACARHVLRDHGGLAGNELADVAREEPQIEIIAGADAIADQHAHTLVLVEAFAG